MNSKRALTNSELLGCLVIFFLLNACAALVAGGAAGGATYIYTKGWVERDYEADLDQVYSAALQATDGLGMTVVEKNKQLASADIQAKKGEQDYWIKMEESGANRTRVSVRSGIMGDRESSQKVHEQIDRLL